MISRSIFINVPSLMQHGVFPAVNRIFNEEPSDASIKDNLDTLLGAQKKSTLKVLECLMRHDYLSRRNGLITYVSQQTIAKEAGYTRRATANTAIQELISLGFVSSEQREETDMVKRKKGIINKTNLYRVSLSLYRRDVLPILGKYIDLSTVIFNLSSKLYLDHILLSCFSEKEQKSMTLPQFLFGVKTFYGRALLKSAYTTSQRYYELGLFFKNGSFSNKGCLSSIGYLSSLSSKEEGEVIKKFIENIQKGKEMSIKEAPLIVQVFKDSGIDPIQLSTLPMYSKDVLNKARKKFDENRLDISAPLRWLSKVLETLALEEKKNPPPKREKYPYKGYLPKNKQTPLLSPPVTIKEPPLQEVFFTQEEIFAEQMFMVSPHVFDGLENNPSFMSEFTKVWMSNGPMKSRLMTKKERDEREKHLEKCNNDANLLYESLVDNYLKAVENRKKILGR